MVHTRLEDNFGKSVSPTIPIGGVSIVSADLNTPG